MYLSQLECGRALFGSLRDRVLEVNSGFLVVVNDAIFLLNCSGILVVIELILRPRVTRHGSSTQNGEGDKCEARRRRQGRLQLGVKLKTEEGE